MGFLGAWAELAGGEVSAGCAIRYVACRPGLGTGGRYASFSAGKSACYCRLRRCDRQCDIVLKNDVIVVGYSGLEDNIAQKWLRACLRNECRIWWCLFHPSKKEEGSERKEENESPDKPSASSKLKLPPDWPDRWMPREKLTIDEQEKEIRRLLENPKGSNLRFVRIDGADDFALRFGGHPTLALDQARHT